MKQSIILLLSSFLIWTNAQGQANPNQEDNASNIASEVVLQTKHYGDKIVLRWAPATAETWFNGMKYGYQVARKDMSDVRNPYEVIVDTVKAWTEAEIEKWYMENPDNEELALPIKTMYQEWEDTYFQGGTFADLMESHENFEQRHQMTLLGADIYPIVADAAGMRYVDNDIEKDKFYSYKVSLNMPRSYHKDYSVVRRNNVIDKPRIFEAKEKEGHIVITWDRDIHQQVYTAYHIERSKDSINWERLTENPYVQGVGENLTAGRFISYMERVENYQPHYYRLIGIDPFGDYSTPSTAVLAEGKDRTPPVVEKPIVKESEDGRSCMITWSHDNMDEISQCVIYKEDDVEEKILYNSSVDGYTLTVEDNDLQEGLTEYFLLLVDTAGNYGQAQPVEIYVKDKNPPQAPQNLQAKVDTSGQVFLSWEQGPDRDILGYYVFTAPRASDNFIKLNQFRHNYLAYADTINMSLLNDKRYYKVCAVDKAGNIGAYSEILEVVLPDKIPPAPSLFYNYYVDSAGVFLGLMSSSSIDVVEHRVYRREKGEEDWEIIRTFGQDAPEIFLDNKVKPAKNYQYKFIAVDEGGLESSAENSTLNIKSFDTRIVFRPILKVTPTEEGIDIKVGDNIPGDNYRVQIVRAINQGKYRTLTTLKNTLNYTHKIKKENGKYPEISYRAKILYKDGARSKFGPEALVKQ